MCGCLQVPYGTVGICIVERCRSGFLAGKKLMYLNRPSCLEIYLSSYAALKSRIFPTATQVACRSGWHAPLVTLPTRASRLTTVAQCSKTRRRFEVACSKTWSLGVCGACFCATSLVWVFSLMCDTDAGVAMLLATLGIRKHSHTCHHEGSCLHT